VSVKIACDFCYHNCLLSEGQLGLCKVRKNQEGKIVTIGYGQIVASAMDPIEKKPMYHLLPGAKTYSIALFGCNYSCLFCQNHTISQPEGPYYNTLFNGSYFNETSVEELIAAVVASKSPIVSYTYSDPIVWQDYMLEAARLAHSHNLLNCMVTNGSFSKKSLERVIDVIDAFNIDVKGDEHFYKKYCKGSLEPVLEGIEKIASTKNRVLEVTTLLIEDLQSLSEIKFLAKQLSERGVEVWHLSRFFPHYKMRDLKSTSEEFMIEAINIAKDAKINYVYAGNSFLENDYPTVCPTCKSILIKGHSYRGEAKSEAQKNIKGGRCFNCNGEIYGLFS